MLQSLQGLFDLDGDQRLHVLGRGAGVKGVDDDLPEVDLRVACHRDAVDRKDPGYRQQDEEQTEQDPLAQGEADDRSHMPARILSTPDNIELPVSHGEFVRK